MNIFHNFVSIFGGPGKAYVESRGTKCHGYLITLETYVQQGITMDNKFFIMKTLTSLAIWCPGGGGGASIIRLGPSWFTYTLSLIIIYMSNIEAI